MTGLVSWDDNYLIDREGDVIAYEGSLCCTWSCQKDAGGKLIRGKSEVKEGCSPMKPYDWNKGTVNKIDIDVNKLFCGDTPLAEAETDSGNKYDPRSCYGIHGEAFLNIGSSCAEDDNCKSGNCYCDVWDNNAYPDKWSCHCKAK